MKCNAEALLTRMSVKDGRIVLPDGMSYRLLTLPEETGMTPRVLRKHRRTRRGGSHRHGAKAAPFVQPGKSSGMR